MENRNGVSIEAKVYPMKERKSNVLAMANITIAGCFSVRGVKVVEGQNGPFVSMPQARDGKGEWHDVCYPNNKDFRDQLSQTVLSAYNRQMQKEQPQQSAPRQAVAPQRNMQFGRNNAR